jgi:hypothetical protein
MKMGIVFDELKNGGFVIRLLQMKLCAGWSQNIDVSIKKPLSPKLG